ncbi:hypothetical protein G6F26_013368 [Rhizopus arrhizus]|nr:hypothetical protein G6F26_013368 [Rhizopus arrhizus]
MITVMDIIEMKSTVIPTEATTDTEITMIMVMEDTNIAIKINGQSNTQHNNKPIKQQNQQHNLNVILTQNEYDNPYQAQDIYAAIRPEHPPEVLSSKPYSKPITREKGKQPSSTSVTKRVNKRNQVKETSNMRKQPIQNTGNMEVDSDLPIEIKPKPIRRKTKAPPIRYDIVSDVMNQKADISVADLMVAAPTLRRKLASACKPKRMLCSDNLNC